MGWVRTVLVYKAGLYAKLECRILAVHLGIQQDNSDFFFSNNDDIRSVSPCTYLMYG